MFWSVFAFKINEVAKPWNKDAHHASSLCKRVIQHVSGVMNKVLPLLALQSDWRLI